MRHCVTVILAVALLLGCSKPGVKAPSSGEMPVSVGGGPPPVTTLKGVPSTDEVDRAEVNLGMPVTADQLPQPLSSSDPNQKAVIAKVLGWLSVAEQTAGEISPPARSPSLIVKLKSGEGAAARLAYDCVTTKVENGTQMTCRQATGQVIFHPPGGGEPLRVRSPELAAWLLAGWKQDVNVGPPEQAAPGGAEVAP